MINLLTSRNVKFRKRGVVIKNLFIDAYVSEHLSKITTMLSLSAFCMTTFLFFDRRLGAINYEGVTFYGGSQSLETFLYEVSAVSNSLSLIKDISSLHKYSLFMLQNNNSKGSENSEYSINSGLTGKVRPLHKIFFPSSFNSYEEKLKITLS